MFGVFSVLLGWLEKLLQLRGADRFFRHPRHDRCAAG
jgi:hypothetical protein